MKVIPILAVIFTIVGTVDASLLISIDGVVDPPDTQVIIFPSEEVVVGISGDGLTSGWQTLFLVVQGTASINGGNILYPGSDCWYLDLEEFADAIGESPQDTLALISDVLAIDNIRDMSYIGLYDSASPPAPLVGTLVTGINFRCEDVGDVILSLADVEGNIFDQQVFHQIPEPTTLLLVCFGGLALLKRSKCK